MTWNVFERREKMGRRLRELRKVRKAFSAKDLSETLQEDYGLSIDSTTLTKIETGESRPTIDLLFILCHLYETDMNTVVDSDMRDERQELSHLYRDLDLVEELQRMKDLCGEQNALATLKNLVKVYNDSFTNRQDP